MAARRSILVEIAPENDGAEDNRDGEAPGLPAVLPHHRLEAEKEKGHGSGDIAGAEGMGDPDAADQDEAAGDQGEKRAGLVPETPGVADVGGDGDGGKKDEKERGGGGPNLDLGGRKMLFGDGLERRDDGEAERKIEERRNEGDG